MDALVGGFALIVYGIPIVSAILGGIIAGNKYRSKFGWVVLCLVFPPCLLILLALKPLTASDYTNMDGTWDCPNCGKRNDAVLGTCKKCFSPRPGFTPDTEIDFIAKPQLTTCPFCKEDIRVGAIVCKHCGRDLDEPAA